MKEINLDRNKFQERNVEEKVKIINELLEEYDVELIGDKMGIKLINYFRALGYDYKQYDNKKNKFERAKQLTYGQSQVIMTALESKIRKLEEKLNKTKDITCKINKDIMDQWNEFCNSNSDYIEEDLVANALVDYMNKFK